MLATRVAEGVLPPVGERLPENPLVVEPLDEIGRYGGTIRRALTGDVGHTAAVNKTMSDGLVGWERPLPLRMEMNLAESFEYQYDGRVAVFKLRRGIKWSDGHPFTVDDILFWYYDYLMNDEARPPGESMRPSRWLQEGQPVGMERIDDVTLRIFADKPLGQLMQALSGVDGCALPKHALKDLHPRYDPTATYAQFQERTTNAQEVMQPGLPRITAWVPVQWIRGQKIIYERNPYYWKVDTAGNQLPYADRLEFQVVPNSQVIALKFINGEIDVFGRYSRVDFFPMLKKEEIENGKIRVLLAGPTRGPALYLNWDAPSTQLRAAFRLKNVRMALSHAINRDEVNSLIYHGLLNPGGYGFVPESPYFSEEDFQRYATYDLELANQYLDEAGYGDSDGDGYREFNDGSRFELTIDVSTSGRSGVDGTKIGELVADYWNRIGIKTNLNAALQDIIWPRRTNGEFEVHLGLLEGPKDPTERPQYWTISRKNAPFWHHRASEEGPEWLFEATRQMERAVTTTNEDQRQAAMDQLRHLHSINIPVIALGSTHMVWGVNRRLGNVPEQIMPDDEYRGWSRPIFHEQLFIRNDGD